MGRVILANSCQTASHWWLFKGTNIILSFAGHAPQVATAAPATVVVAVSVIVVAAAAAAVVVAPAASVVVVAAAT